MDLLLPSEEAMTKMAAEYAEVLSAAGRGAGTLSCVSPCGGGLSPCLSSPLAELLLLYFAFSLGYNFGYGNALAHSDARKG